MEIGDSDVMLQLGGSLPDQGPQQTGSPLHSIGELAPEILIAFSVLANAHHYLSGPNYELGVEAQIREDAMLARLLGSVNQPGEVVRSGQRMSRENIEVLKKLRCFGAERSHGRCGA